MAFFRTVKRPIGILVSHAKLNSPVDGFSIAAVSQPASIAASQGSLFGSLARRFSSQAPSSTEQMDLIKQLRERTSAPIKDVKASLVECNWDIEAAQKDLRKRGKVLAMKKSSRAATEGLLALAQKEGKVAVIELNCETDFVARNEIFQHLALTLAKQALLIENSSDQLPGVRTFGPECFDALKLNLEHPKISGETTVQNAVTEVAAMMGENVKIRRSCVLSTSSNGFISTYLHTSPQPGLGRHAGVLSLAADNRIPSSDALEHVGSELAMHIVAARPIFLHKDLVSPDLLNNEREVIKSQAESTGKPQMAIDKMVEGRLRKYFEEVVFMEQKYFLNDSVSIKKMLDDLSKEVGSPVRIGNFFRMEVGEGIQRQETADEPVAQVA